MKKKKLLLINSLPWWDSYPEWQFYYKNTSFFKPYFLYFWPSFLSYDNILITSLISDLW